MTLTEETDSKINSFFIQHLWNQHIFMKIKGLLLNDWGVVLRFLLCFFFHISSKQVNLQIELAYFLLTWWLLIPFRKCLALIRPEIPRQYLNFLINSCRWKTKQKSEHFQECRWTSEKEEGLIFFFFPFSFLFMPQDLLVFQQWKYSCHQTQTELTVIMLAKLQQVVTQHWRSL